MNQQTTASWGRAKRWAAGLALAGLGLLAGPLAWATPSKIVAFGDSLSDNGNAAAVFAAHGVSLQPSTDYLGGRYSNGPVAVEAMAQAWNVGLEDLAYGGALTGTSNRVGSWIANTGVQSQIATYVSGHAHAVDSAALYVVWAGGNDFLTSPTVSTLNTAVSNLVTDLSLLYAAGARQFFVPNQFDLSSTPLLQGKTAAERLAAQQATLSFNALLAGAMSTLQVQLAGSHIQVFDTYSSFASIQAGLASAGGNVNAACYVSTTCANPSDYLFWDRLHPTATTHAALGQAFYAAAVPEPAPAMLMMLGGVCLVWRRRGRAKSLA